MDSKFGKAVVGGIVGALAMSAVGLWVAPMMGIAKMNPADLLAMKMGGVPVLGWIGHLMIGVILAVVYARFVASRLSGPPAIRGALFSIAPWLFAQLVMMPMMGMPVFSGAVSLAMGSLIGHIVYGLIVGAVVGVPAP
ncbi:MAG: DUF6789 family protein [Gemmatimonadaceae bacterium]